MFLDIINVNYHIYDLISLKIHYIVQFVLYTIKINTYVYSIIDNEYLEKMVFKEK